MDWDILIPILMFAFPIAVAVLDKRAKKRRGVPSVQSRPIFPPAASGSGVRPEKRPAAQDPSQPFDWAPPSYDAEGGTVSPERLPNTTNSSQADRVGRSARLAENNTIEGQRAISRERRREVVTEEKDPEPKLRIDKKNLIFYSEILKPKFDA